MSKLPDQQVSGHWPEGLAACRDCGCPAGAASYCTRGLCSACARKRRKAGTLSDLDRVKRVRTRVQENSAVRAWSRLEAVSVAHYIGRQAGPSRLAVLVNVEQSVVDGWMAATSADWLDPRIPRATLERMVDEWTEQLGLDEYAELLWAERRRIDRRNRAAKEEEARLRVEEQAG